MLTPSYKDGVSGLGTEILSKDLFVEEKARNSILVDMSLRSRGMIIL